MELDQFLASAGIPSQFSTQSRSMFAEAVPSICAGNSEFLEWLVRGSCIIFVIGEAASRKTSTAAAIMLESMKRWSGDMTNVNRFTYVTAKFLVSEIARLRFDREINYEASLAFIRMLIIDDLDALLDDRDIHTLVEVVHNRSDRRKVTILCAPMSTFTTFCAQSKKFARGMMRGTLVKL